MDESITPPSALLSCSFRASDYMIPSMLESPPSKPAGLFKLQALQQAASGTETAPESSPALEDDLSISASTVSIPRESYSPTQRRRRAATDAVPSAACSSHDCSELECGHSNSEHSQSSFSAHPDCFVIESPAVAARADRFATPSAQLRTDSSSQSQGSLRNDATGGSHGISIRQQLDVAEARVLAMAEERAMLQRQLAPECRAADEHRRMLAKEHESRLAALRHELQHGVGAPAGVAVLDAAQAKGGFC